MHISAVERAGLSSLNEGAKVSYEETENRGKTSAENLRVGQKGGFERSPPVPCRRDFQASIERDTDPTRLSPENVTMVIAVLGFDNQVE